MKRIILSLACICFAVFSTSAQCSDSAFFSYTNQGLSYSFTDESFDLDSSATFMWSFGDGDSSTIMNPVHLFDSIGGYNVCETVTLNDTANCKSTYCYNLSTCTIVPTFGYSSSSLFTYTFNGASAGTDSPVVYYWLFGDTSTSYAQSPTHTFTPDSIFNTVDSYYVCLNVYSASLNCSSDQCQTIYITCPAVANFTYTSANTFDYSFTSTSTGTDNSATYLWDFGDGITSTTINPAHTFSTFGNHTVCLTVTNQDESCSNQHCSTFTITCPAQASFTETSSDLYNYSFLNTSAGTDISTIYSWNFGDGDTASQQNPTHIFDTLGIYQTCLTITDTSLNCLTQICDTISILCPGTATYTYTIDTNGLTYNFSDKSTGENTSTTFAWNFGDGNTSSTQNAVNTFSTAGNYNVCLVVDNDSLSCVNQFCNNIAVCPVSANYTYSIGRVYTSYQFNDASNGEHQGDRYIWAFGDGDTSYLQNPQHNYNHQDSFSVCLTVISIQGCSNTYCSTVAVECPVVANFDYTNTDTSGYNYQFYDISTGEDSTTTWKWTFGNGDSSTVKNPTTFFPTAKGYNICLTVTDPDQSCSQTVCYQVGVCQAIALLTYTTTNTYTFHFYDISTGEDSVSTTNWTFGDGGSSTEQNPTHTYSALDTFTVCLTVTDPILKCSNQYCAVIAVVCQLQSAFTFTDSDIYTAKFMDSTTGEDNTSTYAWIFGDGGTSTQRNPTHTYFAPGNYNACLTVTDVDLNCSSTSYCRDVAICPSSAKYAYVSNSLYDYQFTDSSSGESASTILSWDFGDNTTSQQQNPEHTFSSPGTYYACLTLTDTVLRCYTQYCEALSVACPDTASFTYYPVIGWEYNFVNTSVGRDSSSTYAWSFGDGGISTDTFPTHQFDSVGTYPVCMTILNTDVNCYSHYCTDVPITCSDSAAFSFTDSNFLITFTDNSTGENFYASFVWDFGDHITDTAQNPKHQYSSPGAYSACLTVNNYAEQCPVQFCQAINLVCPDSNVFFVYTVIDSQYTFVDETLNEVDSVSYVWTFGDDSSSTAMQPTHVYRRIGQYIACMNIDMKTMGCISELCDTVTVVDAGLNTLPAEDFVKLYPNPAPGSVNIDVKDFTASEIRIYNNLGQQVLFQQPQQSGIIEVSLAGLSAGMYSVRIALKNAGIANMRMVISY